MRQSTADRITDISVSILLTISLPMLLIGELLEDKSLNDLKRKSNRNKPIYNPKRP